MAPKLAKFSKSKTMGHKTSSESSQPAIPDFLVKRGITDVCDNVPDGHRVYPAGLSQAFVTLFRDELLGRLTNPQEARQQLPGEVTHDDR